MSEEELTHRLRSRLQRTGTHDSHVEASKAVLPPVPMILPSSEQGLGRLMERMDIMERRLNLTYKVVWRTSATLVGLAAASFGWDWVAKLLKGF